jgi:hypothetical protein
MRTVWLRCGRHSYRSLKSQVAGREQFHFKGEGSTFPASETSPAVDMLQCGSSTRGGRRLAAQRQIKCSRAHSRLLAADAGGSLAICEVFSISSVGITVICLLHRPGASAFNLEASRLLLPNSNYLNHRQQSCPGLQLRTVLTAQNSVMVPSGKHHPVHLQATSTRLSYKHVHSYRARH